MTDLSFSKDKPLPENQPTPTPKTLTPEQTAKNITGRTNPNDQDVLHDEASKPAKKSVTTDREMVGVKPPGTQNSASNPNKDDIKTKSDNDQKKPAPKKTAK